MSWHFIPNASLFLLLNDSKEQLLPVNICQEFATLHSTCWIGWVLNFLISHFKHLCIQGFRKQDRNCILPIYFNIASNRIISSAFKSTYGFSLPPGRLCV